MQQTRYIVASPCVKDGGTHRDFIKNFNNFEEEK
jgi:hypothetical protein